MQVKYRWEGGTSPYKTISDRFCSNNVTNLVISGVCEGAMVHNCQLK